MADTGTLSSLAAVARFRKRFTAVSQLRRPDPPTPLSSARLHEAALTREEPDTNPANGARS
jgi:hypothetical protein